MKNFSSDYETRCPWISQLVATLVALEKVESRRWVCSFADMMGRNATEPGYCYLNWGNRCNNEPCEKWPFITLNQRALLLKPSQDGQRLRASGRREQDQDESL